MLSDMLQFSLSKFASQFKPSFGGQGETVASVLEESPSDQEDQSEGGVVNSEGDPTDTQGIPRLDSMTEEEERDLYIPVSRGYGDI